MYNQQLQNYIISEETVGRRSLCPQVFTSSSRAKDSRWEIFLGKTFPKNFAYLLRGPFRKVSGTQPKRLWHGCFPASFGTAILRIFVECLFNKLFTVYLQVSSFLKNFREEHLRWCSILCNKDFMIGSTWDFFENNPEGLFYKTNPGNVCT